MDWFRSHHGAPSDPKWLVVARKAKVAPALVVSTFWMLLDYASQHQDRGSIQGFDVEVAAAFLGIEDAEVEAILQALVERGVIAQGRLASWDKRQPKREDDSKDRVARHRTAKRESETQSHAPVTQDAASVDGETHFETPVTQCNADVTQCNDREKEREKERSPLPPHSNAGYDPAKPLPLVVQDFLRSKGEDCLRWEQELRLELTLAELHGSPASYMTAILKRWDRQGLPGRISVAVADPMPRVPGLEQFKARRARALAEPIGGADATA